MKQTGRGHILNILKSGRCVQIGREDVGDIRFRVTNDNVNQTPGSIVVLGKDMTVSREYNTQCPPNKPGGYTNVYVNFKIRIIKCYPRA